MKYTPWKSSLIALVFLLLGGLTALAQVDEVNEQSTPAGVALDITLPDPAVVGEVVIDSLPVSGDLTGTLPTVTYTPNAGFTGEDRFSYTVTSAAGVSRTIVVINVFAGLDSASPIGDPTVVEQDPTTEEESLPVPLSRDVPTTVETLAELPVNIVLQSGTNYSFSAEPQNGVLSGQVPTLTYTPDPGFIGSDSFTYSVLRAGQTQTYTITINVAPNPALDAAARSQGRPTRPLPAPPPREAAPSGASQIEPTLRRLLDPSLSPTSALSGVFDPASAVDGDRVTVIMSVRADAVDAVTASVSSLGGVVLRTLGNNLIAEVPFAAVEPLAALNTVNYVRLPQNAVLPQSSGPGGDLSSPLTGEVVSEGVAAMNADDWQAAGYDGTGIRVGVIDSGFDGLNNLEAPCLEEVESASGGDLNSGNHGRQVVEILCDVAPGIQVYAQDASNEADFILAIDNLISQYDVDIISTSVTFPFTAGDGSSLPAQAVDAAVQDHDVMVVVAAGNNHIGHYEAEFVPNTNDMRTNHRFADEDGGDGQTLNGGYLPVGADIAFALVWDDWAEGGAEDFDLYLYYWNATTEQWELKARSDVANCLCPEVAGSYDPPVEGIIYEVPGQDTETRDDDEDGWYKLAITRWETTRPAWVQLIELNTQMVVEYNFESSSIVGPATAEFAFTVGASSFSDNALQPYSGRGRANASGGGFPDGHFQPQVLGPTGVSTSVTGETSFGGTSASAPHIAAAAALVMQAYPNFTRANVEDFLRNRAADFSDPGETGPDVAYGYGPLWLGNPPDGSGGNGAAGDSIGVFRSSDRTWHLRNSNDAGIADLTMVYGDPETDIPLVGDWDGDGTDTAGIYRNGTFYLRDDMDGGEATTVFEFGGTNPNLIPLVGDWDGDATDTVGVYNPTTGEFFLTNSNAEGNADLVVQYGLPNETPVVGDWNGDGTDTVGIFRADNRTWHLRNSNTPGTADLVFSYGDPNTDTPLVGDWDGDGTDTVGIYRHAAGVFYLKNTNTFGTADMTFQYGIPDETPLIGNWDGANGSE